MQAFAIYTLWTDCGGYRLGFPYNRPTSRPPHSSENWDWRHWYRLYKPSFSSRPRILDFGRSAPCTEDRYKFATVQSLCHTKTYECAIYGGLLRKFSKEHFFRNGLFVEIAVLETSSCRFNSRILNRRAIHLFWTPSRSISSNQIACVFWGNC